MRSEAFPTESGGGARGARHREIEDGPRFPRAYVAFTLADSALES